MYTLYRIACTELTVFKDMQTLLLVYKGHGKKIEPNQYSKPGVHIVQDCLCTAYSIQRYANIAFGV